MTINEYFDKVICINLKRRPDRWAHVESQCAQHKLKVVRFEAVDMPDWGNHGCVASHGELLRIISTSHKWKRCLVLEDDFEFRFGDSQQRFSKMIEQVPEDWWMLYLGGHYGSYDNQRISENVVRFEYMKTTSSYGVTRESADMMQDTLKGSGPIDDLFHKWTHKPCYIFTPRLIKQYFSFSDLQQKDVNNGDCMENTHHERAMGIHEAS